MTVNRILLEGGGTIIPRTSGTKTTTPSTKNLVGSNPGLITSTGGLVGTAGLLFTPAFHNVTQNSFIINHDDTNFDCEENAEYDFRQEADYGEGRECSIHLIILKYRELGKASFNINITVFKQSIDDFVTESIEVSIPKTLNTKSRKQNFPDGRIHTIKLNPPHQVITGERPQITITRDANSGPVSITKLIVCGFADESPQQ